MPDKQDAKKEELYSLLRTHGFDPVLRASSGQAVTVSAEAEVFQFTFDPRGVSAPVTASIDADNSLVIYYGDDVKQSDSEESWYRLLKELKNFAQGHQLSFQLKNKDHLKYDMAKRNHAKISESSKMKKVAEAQSLGGALRNELSKVEPGSRLDNKIKTHNRQIKSGVKDEKAMMKNAPDGYHFKKDGSIALGESSEWIPPELGTIEANLMNTKEPTVQVRVFKHNKQRGDSYWVTKEVKTFKTLELAQAYVDRINKKGVAEEKQNSYFKDRKDHEDRIAGTLKTKPRVPKQNSYFKTRKDQKEQGVAEGVTQPIAPQVGKVLKSLGYKLDSKESTPGEMKSWWRGQNPSNADLVQALSSVDPSLKMIPNWQVGNKQKQMDSSYESKGQLLRTSFQGPNMVFVAVFKKTAPGKLSRQDYDNGLDPSARFEVGEGRFTHGPGGVPLDRQGNPIPPKTVAPKSPRVARDKNGLTKNDYSKVWRKIEEVVGQIFPDGDPIDWLAPWLKKQGIEDFRVGEVLDKACRMNGFDDLYAYYNHFKDEDYGWEERQKVSEGYYPTGRKSSYSDNIPEVKIVLQHSRALEEGERRYRAVEKIFVENQQGERFAIPTNKPGLARTFARHIAEGGTPYDEQGQHIAALCEEYAKMAGFVRATRNKQFNESAQGLVNEGLNHYQKLRESLHKLTTHRGYHAYFENWTPTLMEDDTDSADLSEMFQSSALDPRIECVMPILRKLSKTITEVDHTAELSEWADDVIDEALDHDTDTNPSWKEYQRQRNAPTPAPKKKVDEISNELLGRYKTGAGKQASKLDAYADKMYDVGNSDAGRAASQKATKRFSGIVKATNKQFANDAKFHGNKLFRSGLTTEDLDRLSESAGADYKKFDRLITEKLKLPSDVNTLELYGIYYKGLKESKETKSGMSDVERQLFSKLRTRAVNPISDASVGDKVSLLWLSTLAIPGEDRTIAKLHGFLSPKEITDITGSGNNKQLTFADGSKYPETEGEDVFRTQAWNMTQLFGDYESAHKTMLFFSLEGEENTPELQFTMKVDTSGEVTENSTENVAINPQGIPEDLDANQKAVGQLGPKDKVPQNGQGARGKLVGACESTDPLAHIIKLAKG